MGVWFNAALAVLAGTGSFLFGYDSGVMTDVIASWSFLHTFDMLQPGAESKTDIAPDKEHILGAIMSTFSGGAFFGSLMGGFTMDTLGRRMTLQVGAVICLVGAILQAAAKDLPMMLAGRIVTGWAVGLLSMSVPVYQSECAHPDTRGMLVGITQQMIGVGFIVSSWIGFGSAHVPDSSSFSWRFPLAFQVVPCLIIIFGLFFFPESPRFLVEKGKTEEAKQVLHRLHYNGRNKAWIDQEYDSILTTIWAENEIAVKGWLPMFQVAKWRTRLLHATLMQMFTQLTGINTIGYFQNIMYKNLGIVGERSLLVAGIYNIVGPLTNLFFIVFFLDRIGRVKPLIFGTIGIIIVLVCEAGLKSQIEPGRTEVNGYSIGGLFFIFSVSIIFSMSFGPISWVYMAEIIPMQIRGKGSAFATAFGNWLINTILTQVTPFAFHQLDYKYYFIFITFNLFVTLPVIFLTFKETKRKTLEEIDLLFGERAVIPRSVSRQASVRAKGSK